jgi:hypothetical protein
MFRLDQRVLPADGRSMRIRAAIVLACALLTSQAGACAPDARAPEMGSTDGVVTRPVRVAVGGSLVEAEMAEVPRGFFLGPNGGLWLGRLFVEAEYGASGHDPVAVLTHAFWERLGGDPAMVGSHVAVDGVEHTVVGVTSPGFAVPDGVEVWVPR